MYSMITAKGTAKLWRDHIFREYGYPQAIISDRGPQFVAKFMGELLNLLGVERRLSTAFHPQTNGQAERSNQELEQYLRLYVKARQDDWSEWLALAEFVMNNRVHS